MDEYSFITEAFVNFAMVKIDLLVNFGKTLFLNNHNFLNEVFAFHFDLFEFEFRNFSTLNLFQFETFLFFCLFYNLND